VKELDSLDLEMVASGKSALKDTLGRANRAIDSINSAAGMIREKGGLLLDNGNKILGPLLK
jgi:hypothetical protein